MAAMISLDSPKPRLLTDAHKMHASIQVHPSKSNQVGTVLLYGVPIVSLVIENQERLCLAQISNTLLKEFSYNEIHNRRVALGITCVQCTPVQLEILRRAGAMPVSSRRCGMITRREAERLCKSFLGDNTPPRLPDDFAFSVHHECAWGCRGAFLPSRYNSSRAKCIKCTICGLFFSPNKFIFHSHRTGPNAKYVQPDAANFNSWRRHMRLSGNPPVEVVHAWEDVKLQTLSQAMFNGGTRKRLLSSSSNPQRSSPVKSPGAGDPSPPPFPLPPPPPTRVPPLPIVMDYVWHKHPLSPYSALPWLGLPPASPLLLPPGDHKLYPSAFHPVYAAQRRAAAADDDEETVDIETCPEDDVKPPWSPGRAAAEKPESPTSEPEVDVGSETVEVVETERAKGGLSDDLVAAAPAPVTAAPATAAPAQEPPLWSVARLHRDWPDRALYRHEVARHLSLMRELVAPGPLAEGGAGNPGLSFLSLHAPLPEMNRAKYKEKSPVNSKVDCSTCHHIAGSFTPSLPTQNNN